MLLRLSAARSTTETRCKYLPVSSGPASMRGTVSEVDLTARTLDRGSRYHALEVGRVLLPRGGPALL